jgi:hypothetical protein
MACCRWVDDGVRSPSDNVPEREEVVRRNPTRESHSVKAQGQDTMVKGFEEPHASSRAKQTHGDYWVGSVFPCANTMWSGCSALTSLHGTAVPPASRLHLRCSLWSVLRNVGTLPLRHVHCMAGITVRRAVEGVALRGRKKQMPSCREADRVCDMARPKIPHHR